MKLELPGCNKGNGNIIRHSNHGKRIGFKQ